ncbi:muconate lactonizing mandelate racemase protein [Natrialba hulunbeirensis JCM 10989]|uniref:o-succinylbenzoate synthase n=1 Tax=Natrialba hulunbeirensis JCM 10989 TaxID=1227493 RepID=L9ZJ92_9EURY|nr:o-succinylbenzoate synthase [Natrialba hulunbeirensis]ELY86550.1 muconate lactonizing mandelate racemase protein [Natrialba hulunbeirensis JCM 10989]
MSGDDAPRFELEYRRFSLPLREPLETASGSIDAREGFLLRLADRTGDDTTVGYGEATPLSGWTEPLADCEDALERASRALRDRGTLEDALEAAAGASAARHGVSLAITDCRATGEATPLYRYVGQGPMVGRVPVNATIGDGSPKETAHRTANAVQRGFDCCKLKVGRRPVSADIERIRRTREVVGPDVELRVDANEAWTFDEAAQAIDTFVDDGLGVSIVEQPLPAGALKGHAELRERAAGELSIALDEGLLEHGVDAVCEAQAADILVLKPMALGGIDIARKIAAWVTELGVRPLVTTTIDGVVARTGAVHLAAAIPNLPACGLATGDLLADDLGRDPVLLENGAAVVPQAKGLGIEGVWHE